MKKAYLADTQIVIWGVISPSKIASHVQLLLKKNPIIVSEISLFEITIKQKIGRLPELPLSVDELANQLLSDGFQLLPIKRKHITAYQQIPLVDNHRDPFDRLLLATALAEDISIISADRNFQLYSPTIQLVEA